MNAEELIEYAEKLADEAMGGRAPVLVSKIKAQASEFLRIHAGPRSEFYKNAAATPASAAISASLLQGILLGFAEHIRNGLHESIAPERKVQLDTISDYLAQAQILLADKKVHPAAPTVVIGATLEEFLRTWTETENLPMGNRKPSMDSYAKALREAEAITKQDAKDITSWAGLRNSAAHGDWAEVEDRRRISTMLEGVNLFMRKYGA